MHTIVARDISGKQVYTIGSASLPLKGSHQLEYAVVEDRRGEFTITYQLLPYPFEQEVDYLLRRRFLQEYGPIAWLAFDRSSPSVTASSGSSGSICPPTPPSRMTITVLLSISSAPSAAGMSFQNTVKQ